MNKTLRKDFPKTVEEKLDLIWNRCKKNMSDFSDYETEIIEIRKKVAENNSDPDSPLFRTYIRHLEEIDKYIYFDEISNIYRKTATGLMFKGYVRKKRSQCIDKIIKAIALPTFALSLATFIFLTLKKGKSIELKLGYPTELQLLNERITNLDSLYKANIIQDSLKKTHKKVNEKIGSRSQSFLRIKPNR